MSAGKLFWIIGAAIFILIVNVALSVFYMAIYGHLINPGQPDLFYQEHVKIAAPVSSIIFGIPLFYSVCRFTGSKWERRFAVKAAVAVWFVYFLIDAAVLLSAGLTFGIFALAFVSLSTKFIAAYLGGISASKRESRLV